ncbi:hypothetical protein FO519_005948 [Halicephalobus sp. NKZ332]|nr:hypothetical protein FO519_005948 [Halicephalobus sp. NKZ332]
MIFSCWMKLIFILALSVIYVHARIEFTRFYSDPMEMMIKKPGSLDDLRFQRIRNLKEEKLKRRRAAMPIRITPFYYSMTPVDLLESASVAGSRISGISPYYSNYAGRK